MKKRLRKKKRLGEFREWGRQFTITLNTNDALDRFLDDFVTEAVEGNDLYCGGSGCGNTIDMIVELGRSKDGPESKSRMVIGWIDARSDVLEYKIGDLFDLWHGDYEDMEPESSNT